MAVSDATKDIALVRVLVIAPLEHIVADPRCIKAVEVDRVILKLECAAEVKRSLPVALEVINLPQLGAVVRAVARRAGIATQRAKYGVFEEMLQQGRVVLLDMVGQLYQLCMQRVAAGRNCRWSEAETQTMVECARRAGTVYRAERERVGIRTDSTKRDVTARQRVAVALAM